MVTDSGLDLAAGVEYLKHRGLFELSLLVCRRTEFYTISSLHIVGWGAGDREGGGGGRFFMTAAACTIVLEDPVL